MKLGTKKQHCVGQKGLILVPCVGGEWMGKEGGEGGRRGGRAGGGGRKGGREKEEGGLGGLEGGEGGVQEGGG